eukprot:TRINITY_DN4776_c2_g1_i1.p1 TRINITY_DN4776_c2_g1~~TRINITY_DN4776_c2_g1_i1.p1  ORF type:complete len:1023 (-),score=418.63 TRINITY_DN4776_c2_g1_i1:7-3075(-)
MLKKKELVKVHYDIAFKTVDNLPITSGSVYIEWKRGKKSGNSGETKRAAVTKDKKAAFDDIISLSCSLYKIPKKGYEPKNISIGLYEDKGKKGSSIAKMVVDLAEFAGNKDEKKTWTLKAKKAKVDPNLVVHIRSKETQASPEDEMTETEGGSGGASDDEEGEDFEDDNSISSKGSSSSTSSKRASTAFPTGVNLNMNNTSSTEMEELRASLKKAQDSEAAAKKRSKELAGENVDMEEQIEDLKKENEKLRSGSASSTTTTSAAAAGISAAQEAEYKKRIKDLSKDNSDLEEKIEKLEKDISSSQKETAAAQKEAEEAKKKAVAAQKEADDAKKKAAASPAPAPSASASSSSEKEAELRKRVKELAGDNVDLEEQVEDLKKQVADLKAKSSSASTTSSSTSAKDKENDKKIAELTASLSDRDSLLMKQKQEIENLRKAAAAAPPPVSSPSSRSSDVEAELKKRITEISDENSKLEEEVEDLKSLLNDVKHSVAASSSSKSSSSSEIAEKERHIKDLNEEIKEKSSAISTHKQEIDSLKKDIKDLKRDADSANTKKSRDEKEIASLKEKINELEEEASRSHDKSTTGDAELSAKLDKYKEKLQSQKDEFRRKQEEQEEVENDLRARIQELQSREQEKKPDEGAVEKEKEARKKAEKEVKSKEEKIKDLETQLAAAKTASKSSTNGSASVSASVGGRMSDEKEWEMTTSMAVYASPHTYRHEDGLSIAAANIWPILRDSLPHPEKVKSLCNLISQACSNAGKELNPLFYWLSTTNALLHLLRDEADDDEEDNDRDPIIDGIYKAEKEGESAQERLEWICFSVFKAILNLIYEKLGPILPPIIIEQALDKKNVGKAPQLTRILERTLEKTRNNYLYDAVIQQVFLQIFYFINCHLVNYALQKEKLSPVHGFQIKLGLSHMEEWIAEATGDERTLLSPCPDQLDPLRDLANVLILDKSLLSDPYEIQHIFPALSLRQIKRVLEVFVPDNLSPSPLPPTVLAAAGGWSSSAPLLLSANEIIPFVPRL